MLAGLKFPMLTLALLSFFFAQDALSQQTGTGIELFKTGQQTFQNARTASDREKAAEKFLEALRYFENEKFLKGQGAACDYLGVIYEQLGKLEESLKYHENALAIKRKANDPAGQANTLNNMGMLELKIRNYSRAENLLNDALKIQERADDKKAVAQTEMNLGLIQLLMGNSQKALTIFDKAAKTSKSTNDIETFAKTLLNRGKARIALGDYSEAQIDFQEAFKNADKVRDPQFRMEAQWRLGQALAEQGAFQEANKSLEDALKLDERFSNKEARANILSVMALTARDSGQFDKAHHSINEALSLFKQSRNSRGEAEALNSIGGIYLLQGRYPEAVGKYQEAAQLAGRCGEKRIESRTLHNLAGVYMDSGDFDQAKKNLEKALIINTEIPDVIGQAKNMASLANMHHAQGAYKQAEQNYLRAIDKLKQKGDYRYESRLLNNLGAVYQDQGQYEKAQESYTKSLEIAEKTRSEVPKDRIWDNLGNLAMDKRFADAKWKESARAYVTKLERSELYKTKGGNNASVGRFYYLTGNVQKAKIYYDELLKAAEKSGDVDDLVAAYTGLGLVCEAQGNYSDAEKSFKIAIEQTENIRKSLTPAERPEFFNVTSRGFSRVVPYKGLSRVQIKRGKPEKSFETSEHTKARRFAEEMAGRATVSDLGLSKEIKEKDRRLNETRTTAYRSLLTARRSGSQEAIHESRIKVEDIDRQLKDHRISLLGSADERIKLFALASYPEPLPLDKMALKDSDWVLAYDVTDAGVIVYLLKGKKLEKTLFKATNRGDLQQLIDDFRQSLESPNGLKPFEFSSGKRMGDLLLGGVLEELSEGKTITIVPDGPLQAIPFETLVLNEGQEIKSGLESTHISGAKFFADRNPISYCQSVTTLTLAREIQQKKATQNRILIIADPDFGPNENLKRSGRMATMEEVEGGCLPDVSRLKYTGDLANKLLNIFGKDLTDVHQRGNATKKNLLRNIGPHIDQYEYVIFATHGYFSRHNASIREPVLFLAVNPPYCHDGYLYSNEVQNLGIRAEIVALTACQTGLGKDLQGEGMMSMGSAFLYAGAKSVLITLWQVEEKSAVNLTESFFKHTRQGESKLQALQAARNDIRKAGYDDPYFWAGFILVGEP